MTQFVTHIQPNLENQAHYRPHRPHHVEFREPHHQEVTNHVHSRVDITI